MEALGPPVPVPPPSGLPLVGATGVVRKGNILDIPKDTLSPYVWEDPGAAEPKMRPQIKDWILHRVFELLSDFRPDPEDYATLICTGSLTTYQYSNESDFDISLFINPLASWERSRLISKVIHEFDGTQVAGCPYKIQCFVVSPKISKELLFQPGLRSGYDLESGTWLVPPDKNRAHNTEQEYNGLYIYALEVADKLETLVKFNPNLAIDYWHYLHKRRMKEQTKGKGDFAFFNIIYKMLESRGLFSKLAEITGEHIS